MCSLIEKQHSLSLYKAYADLITFNSTLSLSVGHYTIYYAQHSNSDFSYSKQSL